MSPHDLGGAPDIQLNFHIGINAQGNAFTVNGYTYTAPSVPVLLQILNGVDPKKLLPSGSVIPLPKDKLVELTVPGGSQGSPVRGLFFRRHIHWC